MNIWQILCDSHGRRRTDGRACAQDAPVPVEAQAGDRLPRRAGPLILGVLFSGVALAGGVAFMGLLPAIILGSLAFGGLAFGLGLFATATAVVLPSILAAVRLRAVLAALVLWSAAQRRGAGAGHLILCCRCLGVHMCTSPCVSAKVPPGTGGWSDRAFCLLSARRRAPSHAPYCGCGLVLTAVACVPGRRGGRPGAGLVPAPRGGRAQHGLCSRAGQRARARRRPQHGGRGCGQLLLHGLHAALRMCARACDWRPRSAPCRPCSGCTAAPGAATGARAPLPASCKRALFCASMRHARMRVRSRICAQIVPQESVRGSSQA